MNVSHAVVEVHSIQHRFRTLASSIFGAQSSDGGRDAPHAHLTVTVRAQYIYAKIAAII